MNKELIFMIGEAILLEVEDVKDVTYPKGENPDKLFIELEGGNCYELTLKNT